MDKCQWGTLEMICISIPANAIIPCEECGGIMRKKWDEGMCCDCYPPIHGWDWVCENCGHKEKGGAESNGNYYMLVYLEELK